MSASICASDPVKIQRSAPRGRGVTRRLARTMIASEAGSRPASAAARRNAGIISAIWATDSTTGFQPSASVAARFSACGLKAAR
jgi:hypothetical protein